MSLIFMNITTSDMYYAAFEKRKVLCKLQIFIMHN